MTGRISSSPFVRYAASVALAGAVIEIGRLIGINSATVTLNLVLAVLLLATWWGFPEALIACVTGILGLDYFFLPPDGFGIADPQSWWMMAAFISTALIGSSLSAKARQRVREAGERQVEAARLYELSQAIRICDTEQETMRPVPGQIAQIFGFREVAFHDAASNMTFASTGSGTYLVQRLREMAQGPPVNADLEPEISVLPLQIGDFAIGSIGYCGRLGPEPLRQSIAALVAAFMKACREREEHQRAAEIRTAQNLKSALLDAIVHDLKTPLTSITAVVSCLLSRSSSLTEDDRELLHIVREEAARLDRVASAASAKVLDEEPRIAKYPADIGDVISTAAEQFGRTLGERIVFLDPAGTTPPADIDPDLIEQVLVQVLDNALKYSPRDSAVIVSAEGSEDTVVVHIADSGPGIAEEEWTHIFQPSYRCRQDDRVAGSGMGLSIAKRIMDAHGGRIWVTSPAGAGSVFHISVTAVQEVAHV